jgi:hypothetical protein
MRKLLTIAFVLVYLCAKTAHSGDAELPLLVKEDFERGMARWWTSDPDAAASVWKIIETGPPGNRALRVTGQSKYQPPHRSPHSIALLKDVVVTDFELRVRVQNTNAAAGPHRDLCIFWGYQDPAHFYYVHLGAKADPHACQIFIVNDAPRTMITEKQARGTPWTDGWHTIKVIRRVADGTMKVYFDDMQIPLMTARDKTFTWGQVGIGTFDDHGNFDDIVLRGNVVGTLRVP